MSGDAWLGPAQTLGASGHHPHFGALAAKHAVSTSLAWSLFSKVLNFMLVLALDQIPSAEAGFREKQGRMARTGGRAHTSN